MKKTTIFIIIGIGVIISSAWLIFSEKISQPVFQEEIRIPQKEIKQEVVLVIDEGEEPPKAFEAEFKEGMTAFDLLKKGALELNLALKTKSYDIGIFIEVIGNKENGQDEKYWMYYVNGEISMVAADKQEINPGDKIEFKFEKSPF